MKKQFTFLVLLSAILIIGNAFGESSIEVLSPRGGEVYPPGGKQTVILNTRARTILIELSRDGGKTFETLGSISNIKIHRKLRNRLEWTPSFPVSSQAVLRATSTDKRRPASALSGAFSIGAPALGDSSEGFYVLRSGDTMSGPLVLAGNPTQDFEPATKTYADTANAAQDVAVSSKVSKAGDTISGTLTVTGQVQSNSGFKFPDGTVQVSALVGAGVPSGFSILGDTNLSPTGFTFTGLTLIADSWTPQAPMPTPRYLHAVVSVNGKVYVLGGAITTGPTSSSDTTLVEEYDPTTNTWTLKAPMLTARDRFAAVAVDGKIYALGGDTSVIVALNEVYDPATNTWSTKAPMPTPRPDLAAAVVNGKIYAIGGNDAGGTSAKVEEYDPSTNIWTTKASMPTPRKGLSAVTINGKVYAIGGETTGGVGKVNEEYDPGSDTWTTKTPMIDTRTEFGAATVNGKIIALGGLPSPQTVELYDPAKDSWRKIVSLPVSRTKLAATETGGKVFAIGGELVSGIKTGSNEALSVKVLYVHRKD